jgi:Ca-activated chloride channel family protein
MNQLFLDQTRFLVLEVEIDPGTPGRVQQVADVEVGYRNLMTAQNRTLQSSATVTAAANKAAVEQRRNRDVTVEVVRQIGAEKAKEARAARRG